MPVHHYGLISTESKEFKDSVLLDQESTASWQSQRSKFPVPILGYLLCSVISLVIGVSISLWLPSPIRSCWRIDSTWSPTLNDIDLSYHQVRFKGTLDAPSEYRGELLKTVDNAWSVLEEVGTMWITPEDFDKFGGDPKTSVKLSEAAGNLYVGELEIFHQLHCLNYIRKASHWNYEHYVTQSVEFTDSETTQKVHFDHCIEMLRKQLECKADVGFINFQWVNRTTLGYYPNFNTVHQCRNYESIREFVLGRKLGETVLRGLRMQPGQEALTSLP